MRNLENIKKETEYFLYPYHLEINTANTLLSLF